MSCPPPPSAVDPIAELRLAALPSAVSNSRRFARHQLRLWGLDELVHDVEILVSELVTNSTEATGVTTTPTSYAQLYDQRLATVLLRLRITKDDLYIEVWDASGLPPVRAPLIPSTSTAADSSWWKPSASSGTGTPRGSAARSLGAG
jgi:anti-sigma regulatory factor (Ser/Thr protein kinase)